MEKSNLNHTCNVLIIGGSAGSLDLLINILPQLNQIKSFAIVIVIHRKNSFDTSLEELLSLKTNIPVKTIEDKDRLILGNIYVAPADYHLLFETNGLFSLDISEKVNYSRPSIDVAFESAAAGYKSNLTGLLLTGANSDGTAGLKAIQQEGGIILVQDPESAESPFMPQHAIQNLSPHLILNSEGIIKYINNINR